MLETCRGMKKRIVIQKFCASSWLITEINIIFIYKYASVFLKCVIYLEIVISMTTIQLEPRHFYEYII